MQSLREGPDLALSRVERLELRKADTRWDRYDTALAGVGAIATIFVHPVHAMLTHPYWFDEAWVAVLTKAPFRRLPDLSASAPMGFAALLKLVPGTGLQRGRLVPLGFTVLTVVMAYVLARTQPWAKRAAARLAAIAAALLVMLVPLSLQRNDLKQYTCDAFFALVLLTIGAWAEREPHRSRLFWLAGAAIVAIPFSSASAFVTAAMFAGLFASALWARNRQRMADIATGGFVAAVGVGAYMGVVLLPTLNPSLKNFWATYYLSGTPIDVVRDSWDRLAAIPVQLAMPVPVFIGLFVAGIGVLLSLRSRALAIALPVLWIEMVAAGRLRKYPYLDVRTSHFLLIASFVMVAIGAAGLLLALARVGRVAGPRAGVVLATAVGCVMAACFTSAFHQHVGQLAIRGEDVRSGTLAVAARRTADDVILVSSSARYGFSYYWPHSHIVFHSDTSGQGFWPEVSGLGAIYARGRTDADVLAALRTAVDRWHASPKGSRLLIVRTHLSPDELLAWHAAFDKFGLKPHRENFGGDVVLVVPPGGG